MPVGKRLSELLLGHTANQLLIFGFDYCLYPAAIAILGVWRGGTVMSVLSFLVCLLLLKFYDWSKRDWLGIEAVKSMKHYEGNSRLGRLIAWLLCRGDAVACVTLSLRYDPFITTAYLRRGAFNGMMTRDWRIFVLSWFIGNAWWCLFCYAGVETVAGLWRWIVKS